MKRAIRSGERRGFRAAAGRATRTVADMFDQLITWFTPGRRARIALPAEIAFGAWLALASLLNQQWGGGGTNLVLAIVSIGMGAAVAMHRVRPALATIGLALAFWSFLLTLWFGIPFNGFLVVAAAVVVFGAVAYGSSSVRWIGAGATWLVSLSMFVAIVRDSGIYFGVDIAFIVGQWLSFLVWPVLALLPWVLGELVRSIRNRRQLSATVATVSTQRDAALTRADLEAERTRVARDVHDIVAHSLTVVIAQADGARYATAGDSPAAAESFETIAQTARDALADVRVLLTELRHTQEAGPQPGLNDLDALLDSMRDSGLALEVREFGDRGRLTESRELALYRIVQESLTNALRHGDGAATLELEWGEQAVDLVVTNGSLAETPESKDRGHGIDGMRERASLAGGELSVHEGAVFRVRARLLLEARVAEPAESADELVTAGAPA